MRQVSSATIEKYKALLSTRLFTDSDMVYFRSLLNNGLRHDQDLTTYFLNYFNTEGVNLDFEAVTKGLVWLRKTQVGAKGNLKPSAFIGQRELDILNSADTIVVAELVNLSRGTFPQYTPVYEVRSKLGNFKYHMQADGTYVSV